MVSLPLSFYLNFSLCPGLAFCHCIPLSFWSLIVASGSKSQNALWNAITAGIGIKDKDKRGILIDPRSPEEILADDLPSVDGPDAMEKTAIRFGGNHTLTHSHLDQSVWANICSRSINTGSALTAFVKCFFYTSWNWVNGHALLAGIMQWLSHKVLCMFIFYS